MSGGTSGDVAKPSALCLPTALLIQNTAVVRAVRASPDAADAIADPQSNQSQYGAAAELHAKHDTFNAQHEAFIKYAFNIEWHSADDAKQRFQ